MKLKQLFLFVLFINNCYGFMNSKIPLKSISNKNINNYVCLCSDKNNNFNKIIKSEQFDFLSRVIKKFIIYLPLAYLYFKSLTVYYSLNNFLL